MRSRGLEEPSAAMVAAVAAIAAAMAAAVIEIALIHQETGLYCEQVKQNSDNRCVFARTCMHYFYL